MKLTKRILALLIAFTMVFAMAACGENNTSNGSGDTTSAPENDGNNGDSTDETPAPNLNLVLPEYEDFDFGVFSFNATEFEFIQGTRTLLGDNLNVEHGGEEAVKLAGFQGYEKPDDGFPGDDPDGEFQTLISQNGKFWSNIAKIEAEFFFSGVDGTEAEDIANAEMYAMGGYHSGWKWWASGTGSNMISEYDEARCEKHEGVEEIDEEEGCDECGFQFGYILKAVWDMSVIKEEVGKDANDQSKDIFDMEPEPVSEEEGADIAGGGVSKFGVMLNVNTSGDREINSIENVPAKIHWTDVKIYVYDYDLFMEFVEEVEEKMGKKMSENTKDRVIEADSED